MDISQQTLEAMAQALDNCRHRQWTPEEVDALIHLHEAAFALKEDVMRDLWHKAGGRP